MRKTLIALSLSLLFILVPDTTAQDLKAGTWTGYIVPPDGMQQDVTYEVTVEDDSLMIVMSHVEMGLIPFLKLTEDDDGGLVFEWNVGVQIFCSLTPKEDGSYVGSCADAGGVPGEVAMIPPEDEEN